MRTVAAVISRCATEHKHASTDWQGECLTFVRAMLAAPLSGSPDAIAAWNKSKLRVHDTKPPRGYPVYWSGGSHGHGHAAISAGDGSIYSTDLPQTGKVGLVPIGEPHRRWGLTYLGWCHDYAGMVEDLYR
jgi:hypothetical protein